MGSASHVLAQDEPEMVYIWDARVLPQAEALTDAAQVWVLTQGPGEAIHTIFGHTSLLVLDQALPTGGVTFNFGTFEFGEGFVWQFMGGELDYLLSTGPSDAAEMEAKYFDKAIVQQRLALEPREIKTLYAMLRDQAQPANRAYRYRFIEHNCSTKIYDLLEQAFEDRLQWTLVMEGQTYRDQLHSHLQDLPMLGLAIDLVLGEMLDREASEVRSQVFLPVFFMQALDNAQINRDGQWQPLVAQRVGEMSETPLGKSLPVWWGVWAWLIAAVGVSVLITVWPKAMHWPGRIFDVVWLIAAGAGGGLLVWLMINSAHPEVWWNLMALVFLPSHLLAAAWVVQWPGNVWFRRYAALGAGLALVALLLSATLGMKLLALGVMVRLAHRCLTDTDGRWSFAAFQKHKAATKPDIESNDPSNQEAKPSPATPEAS